MKRPGRRCKGMDPLVVFGAPRPLACLSVSISAFLQVMKLTLKTMGGK